MSRDLPSGGDPAAGFLSFTLGGESYIVDVGRVRETLRPQRVTPVPRAPEAIRGIISRRGTIMPVLDLAERLGVSRPEAAGSGWIIVIRQGEGWCGLQVDRIGSVVMLPPSALEPALSTGSERRDRFIAGAATCRGAQLMLLDLDAVLAIGTGTPVGEVGG